jgi:hypothetical protein
MRPGPQDRRTAGPQDRRTAGPQDRRTAGPQDRRTERKWTMGAAVGSSRGRLGVCDRPDGWGSELWSGGPAVRP